MSIYRLNENASYEQIRNAARQRLSADRAAGGRGEVRADRLGPELTRHVTAAREKGDPCIACGRAWPCGTIRFILSPKEPRRGRLA